jgi:CMP-N-acetylneuraminic acid synthetase
MEMDPIALIQARGGSRRLKRKNVLPFAGKPLLEWTILQARCAKCFRDKDIYLSTDDDEIAEVGHRNNINVIRRPDWPDADLVSGGSVWKHMIGEIWKKRKATHAIGMLPTTPCRLPDDIDNLLKRYLEIKPLYPNCHEVISITPVREFLLFKHLQGPECMYQIFDNQWGYMIPGPATHLYELDWYYDFVEIEPGKRNHDITEISPKDDGRLLYYNPTKWFQQWDIDDRDTFDLNELIFEKFILRGEDETIYRRYKNGDMAQVSKGKAARLQESLPGEKKGRGN